MTNTRNKNNKENMFLDFSEYWEDSSIIFPKNTKKDEDIDNVSLSSISQVGERNDLYTPDENPNDKNENEIEELVTNIKVNELNLNKERNDKLKELVSNTHFSTTITEKIKKYAEEKNEITFMKKKTKRK